MSLLSVMVVEEEGAQREALAEFLRWRGYRVVTFASGRDAVDWLRSEDEGIAAAIVNWHLPGVGGGGVVASLRERFPEIPVIVASGSPLSASERHRPQWSVAIRKPFSMRRITHVLSELVQQT